MQHVITYHSIATSLTTQPNMWQEVTTGDHMSLSHSFNAALFWAPCDEVLDLKARSKTSPSDSS